MNVRSTPSGDHVKLAVCTILNHCWERVVSEEQIMAQANLSSHLSSRAHLSYHGKKPDPIDCTKCVRTMRRAINAGPHTVCTRCGFHLSTCQACPPGRNQLMFTPDPRIERVLELADLIDRQLEVEPEIAQFRHPDTGVWYDTADTIRAAVGEPENRLFLTSTPEVKNRFHDLWLRSQEPEEKVRLSWDDVKDLMDPGNAALASSLESLGAELIGFGFVSEDGAEFTITITPSGA